MCLNDPMCNKRFLLHALLVTTLKSHMCLQQSGCVLWLSSLLRFLWFGFLWISQGFALVGFFPPILYMKEFLTTETFCPYNFSVEKLYCIDPTFPCWMQEDGLDGFLKPLQHFFTVALCFYCCLGVGAIWEVLICAECSPVNYSLYFAIWLPDN